MCQFSVYMRFCGSKDNTETYVKRIKKALPPSGNVQLIRITDKQYENIISFTNHHRDSSKKNPDQYMLF